MGGGFVVVDIVFFCAVNVGVVEVASLLRKESGTSNLSQSHLIKSEGRRYHLGCRL